MAEARRRPQGIPLYFQGLERSISPNLPAKTGRGSYPLSLAEEFDFSRMGEQVVENTAIADYVWLPISFEGDKPVIHWLDSWRWEDFE